MSNKDKAFKLFDSGMTSVKEVAKKIGASDNSVRVYKTEWNKSKDERAEIDKLADSIFGEDESARKVPSSQQNSSQEEKRGRDKKIYTKTKEACTSENIRSDGWKPDKEFINTIQKWEKPQVNLEKVIKLVEIKGQFATYKPSINQTWDIELDGQVFGLSREQMKTLAYELLAVSEEV